jgi:hypothetical protein
MHFKPGALFWRVIGGPPQGDNRIKSVFSAASPALLTTFARMMNENNRFPGAA